MIPKKPQPLVKLEKEQRVSPEAFVQILRMERWIEYERARAERAIEALTKIACFNDEGASMVLKHTNSYGFFDEPNSVEDARQALQDIE